MTLLPDLDPVPYQAPDGQRLVYRETGAGRPLVLVHGFFSSAYVNWIRYGHAELLADAGYRVVMPDLRGHGESAKPHDPAAYPRDVLSDDVNALIAHLGLNDYDLGGYSLGARTTVRMLARGARPRRALLMGMGLQLMTDTSQGEGFFRRVLENYGSFRHGDPEFMSQAFLKTVKGDPQALLCVLDTSVDTPENVISTFDLPVGIVMGAQDGDHGDAKDLQRVLPDSTYFEIPGDHMGAVSKPELGQAIAEFLGAP